MGFMLVVLLACLMGIATLLGVWAIAVYNGLVRLHHQIRDARAQIDAQRRNDLLATVEELHSTEQLIGTACLRYNDTVRAYNAKLQSMPTSLVATLFAFKAEDVFEIETVEGQTPPSICHAA